MSKLLLRYEVGSFEREKPQDFEGDGEVGSTRPYTGKETIAYPLVDYLRRNSSYTRKRISFDGGTDLFLFRVGKTLVQLRYYGVNEESDWPFSYPEIEVVEVRLSDNSDKNLIARINEFGPRNAPLLAAA